MQVILDGLLNKGIMKPMWISIIGLLFLVLAGATDGAVEGFDFKIRKSFEVKYNVSPEGFWGSRSWEKAHSDPNIWNKYLGVFDFYHVADDLRKLFYMLGAVFTTIGAMKQDKKRKLYQYITYFIIVFFISGIAKKIALDWITT